MDINFKHHTNATDLQQKLYALLPIGSSSNELKQFCLKNWVAMTGTFQKSEITLVNSTDIDFDTYVMCSAEAPNEKFPWSVISLSNGWIWLISCYYKQNKLVKINVELTGNGL
jgi:hypothetical protein